MKLQISRAKCRGFSLMELAIVLMIVGTLMSGLLVGISQSAESARRASALSQLRNAEEALYGFASATGRLPCPGTDSSAGFEAIANAATGNCTAWHGFLPASTLGLTGTVNTDGMLLDPWQNPYRYSVAAYDPTSDGDYDFTLASELAALFATGTVAPNGQQIRVCDAATCSGQILTNTSPALVFSMGSNWADYIAANEQENAGGTLGTYDVPDDNDFVATIYSEDSFDDQLVWLSPYILFNRMISAGKLP